MADIVIINIAISITLIVYCIQWNLLSQLYGLLMNLSSYRCAPLVCNCSSLSACCKDHHMHSYHENVPTYSGRFVRMLLKYSYYGMCISDSLTYSAHTANMKSSAIVRVNVINNQLLWF